MRARVLGKGALGLAWPRTSMHVRIALDDDDDDERMQLTSMQVTFTAGAKYTARTHDLDHMRCCTARSRACLEGPRSTTEVSAYATPYYPAMSISVYRFERNATGQPLGRREQKSDADADAHIFVP